MVRPTFDPAASLSVFVLIGGGNALAPGRTLGLVGKNTQRKPRTA